MFNPLTDDHRKLLADMKHKNRTAGEIASYRASLMRGYTTQQADEKLKTLHERQNKRNTKKQPVEPQIVDTLPIPQVAAKPKRQTKPKQPVEPQIVEPVQEPTKPKPRARKQPAEPAPVAQVVPVQEAPKPKRGKKQQEPPLAPVAEEPAQEPKPKARGKWKNNHTVEIFL